MSETTPSVNTGATGQQCDPVDYRAELGPSPSPTAPPTGEGTGQ